MGKEIHPFTISSHPTEEAISFAIKILGDYTKTLDLLKVGDEAKIWEPHGKFADKFLESNNDVVFIGGGIGTAPFLGMLKQSIREDKNQKVNLFYCTKYREDAYFDEEISNYVNSENASYLNKYSRRDGHLSIDEILEKINDVKNTYIFICGLKNMTSKLVDELISHKIPSKNIITENF